MDIISILPLPRIYPVIAPEVDVISLLPLSRIYPVIAPEVDIIFLLDVCEMVSCSWEYIALYINSIQNMYIHFIIHIYHVYTIIFFVGVGGSK